MRTSTIIWRQFYAGTNASPRIPVDANDVGLDRWWYIPGWRNPIAYHSQRARENVSSWGDHGLIHTNCSSMHRFEGAMTRTNACSALHKHKLQFLPILGYGIATQFASSWQSRLALLPSSIGHFHRIHLRISLKHLVLASLGCRRRRYLWAHQLNSPPERRRNAMDKISHEKERSFPLLEFLGYS